MITREQALDINFLKSNCKKIHFFGLGFIQIKLSDEQRVHVYTDKFPMTAQEEDIHNHRYDFNSQILKGLLTQKTYQVFRAIEETPFEMKKESCKENFKVEEETEDVDVELTGVQHFNQGSTYFITHDTFHQVASSNAVTLITRSGYKKDLAEVIYNKENTPVCPFSIKITEDELWKIVEESLK